MINQYVYAAIAAVIVGIWLYVSSVIDGLQEAVEKGRYELQVCANEKMALSMSNKALSEAVDRNNAVIELMKVDVKEATDKYNKLKSQAPKVVEKYIDRTIVKSEECDDIKSIVNGLSHIDYDRL